MTNRLILVVVARATSPFWSIFAAAARATQPSLSNPSCSFGRWSRPARLVSWAAPVCSLRKLSLTHTEHTTPGTMISIWTSYRTWQRRKCALSVDIVAIAIKLNFRYLYLFPRRQRPQRCAQEALFPEKDERVNGFWRTYENLNWLTDKRSPFLSCSSTSRSA